MSKLFEDFIKIIILKCITSKQWFFRISVLFEKRLNQFEYDFHWYFGKPNLTFSVCFILRITLKIYIVSKKL